MKNELNSVVTNIIQVSPIMRILRIKPDGWQLPPFVAGQYMSFGLPVEYPRVADATPEEKEYKPGKIIRRMYSIASSSVRKEYIEFYITLVRSGALTPRIFALQVGDRVMLGQKTTGMFTLDEVDADQHIVLVATGTGVAPYISMLRSNALGIRTGKMAVIHGATNSWDLGYSSELTLIESMSDKFSYIPTILQPESEPGGWTGETRLVEEIWKDDTLEQKWGVKPTPENTHIFLCGNPNMTSAMLEILTKQGFKEHSRKEPGHIHVEQW